MSLAQLNAKHLFLCHSSARNSFISWQWIKSNTNYKHHCTDVLCKKNYTSLWLTSWCSLITIISKVFSSAVFILTWECRKIDEETNLWTLHIYTYFAWNTVLFKNGLGQKSSRKTPLPSQFLPIKVLICGNQLRLMLDTIIMCLWLNIASDLPS